MQRILVGLVTHKTREVHRRKAGRHGHLRSWSLEPEFVDFRRIIVEDLGSQEVEKVLTSGLGAGNAPSAVLLKKAFNRDTQLQNR